MKIVKTDDFNIYTDEQNHLVDDPWDATWDVCIKYMGLDIIYEV